MAPEDDPDRTWPALAKVTEAGLELERARALLVARAKVALAAGADEAAVAESAGVGVRTLRLWLTDRAPHARG
ncbi:hypothetical protein [Ornithinimicrobium cerasi]|uniref:hypothetical protein n=1 Tax=Ornithinimicrobium cerasi TaxID=2248773 RepID=UPI00137B3390|nr:hypothetical protein [Ornithinimicrobium cerasi]